VSWGPSWGREAPPGLGRTRASPLEDALNIPAHDAGGDVELPGELCLDPTTGETPEFAQASQDGPLPDPCPDKPRQNIIYLCAE
jgi:hypothetical protein